MQIASVCLRGRAKIKSTTPAELAYDPIGHPSQELAAVVGAQKAGVRDSYLQDEIQILKAR